MRKTKEKTYKAALIILFVAVIICGLLIQGGQALEKTSLSPDFYRRLLNDPEVYDHIWSQLWQGITGLEEPPADSLVFSAFQHAFDEEWLKEQLGRFAGTVLDFIKGDSRQLILELDIGERKKLSAGAVAPAGRQRVCPWPPLRKFSAGAGYSGSSYYYFIGRCGGFRGAAG